MNSSVVISLLCMVSGSLHAMNSRVITHEEVTLVMGEDENTVEIQIPLRYARLSKTLSDCLKDCTDEKPVIPVPLLREVGAFLVGQLEMLYNFMHQDQRQALGYIKDNFERLDSTKLVVVLRALDYLDIPLLPKIGYEEILKRSRGSLAGYSVASLPQRIRCGVMRSHLAHLLGLTYGKGSTRNDVAVSAQADNLEHDYKERRAFIIVDHAVCRGHEESVNSVCVTADNKIVSGSRDNTIRVWDMQGNQLAVCRGHEESVNSVCVTADNKIVSGSRDNTIRVWDMQGNQLAVCRGHEESVNSVCVTADNKIVSASLDNTIRVWDMQGNELAVCRGHQGRVLSVCVTLDNKIVSGSADKTVRVWDMQGSQLAVCRGHEGPAYSVFVTGDNKIVSGSDDKTVRIWDMQGNELAVCRGHKRDAMSVCVTGDNKIVSGSSDCTVRVWDMQGNELAVCRDHLFGVISVCVTGDDKIVSGSGDGKVHVWDMQGNKLAECREHEDFVWSVCVTADNKIVSGSWDNTVRVWDIETLILLEKALRAVSESVEKSTVIWDLMLNYSTDREDTQNFSNELNALI
jgi:WD40 repeat protein